MQLMEPKSPLHAMVGPIYFNPHGNSINCMVVVNNWKHCLNLCLGMSRSTKDACVLHQSSLYSLTLKLMVSV